MHIPVLTKEVIKYLNVQPNGNYMDATMGQGGHTKNILERNGPRGKVLGIEWDRKLYRQLKKKFEKQERVMLANESYVFLEKIVDNCDFGPVHGVLFDLGLSSWHLEESGRGFSFQRDEPLDMRYNQMSNKKHSPLTAEKIVNTESEKAIAKIIKTYSGERYAKRIAIEIVKAREQETIKTTSRLVKIIKKAVPGDYEHGRIHPATRAFQALRIAVNAELENLKAALPQALNVLTKGGRLVVISFQSLEDEIVKNFFKQQEQKGQIKILTKRPVRPSEAEIRKNRRARSAKLRAAEAKKR